MRRWINSFLGNMMMFYTVIVLLSMVIVGYSYFSMSKSMLIKQITEHNNQTLDYIQNNLKMMIDQMIAVVNMYNINDNLKTALQKDYVDEYDWLKRINNISNELAHSNYAFDWMQQSITVIGKNGLIASTGMSSIVNKENIDSYPWYSQVKNNPTQINWYGPQAKIYKNDKQMISAIKVLEMETFTDYYGVMILSIEEQALYQIYKHNLNSDQQIVYIVDKEGNIISHSQRDMVGQKVDGVNILKEDKSQEEKIINYKGKNIYMITGRCNQPDGALYS